MAKHQKIRLSDQQFQIVQALNRLGGGTAKQVQQELSDLELAVSTIATVLMRLEKKGVLKSTFEGRERIYQSAIQEESIRKTMVSSLISTVFQGDPKALMAHLVREGEIKPSELQDLGKLIETSEKANKAERE